MMVQQPEACNTVVVAFPAKWMTTATTTAKKMHPTRWALVLCSIVGICTNLSLVRTTSSFQQPSVHAGDIMYNTTTNTTTFHKHNRFVKDLAAGVDPIYLQLLQEAERRSAASYETSHQQGEMGVCIGPTDGDFFLYTLPALQNAQRIRYILADNPRNINICLMTSQEHYDILTKQCANGNVTSPTKEFKEACRLWANNTLFDHVIITKDYEFQGNDNHASLNQGTSNHWLKALGGYRLAPYNRTLFLDSDAWPCQNFERMFGLVQAPSHWQIPTEGPVDLAIGLEQFAKGPQPLSFWTPGDERVDQDFRNFRERNTGSVLFHFHSKEAHTFTEFLPLVASHVYCNVATPTNKVPNDQLPFGIALFLFKRLVPEFNEQSFPMHSSCRSYPGNRFSGTDGFKNGMFPLQQDGKHCNECRCTPCDVAHTRLYPVYINGSMGWEEGLPPFNIANYLGVDGYYSSQYDRGSW